MLEVDFIPPAGERGNVQPQRPLREAGRPRIVAEKHRPTLARQAEEHHREQECRHKRPRAAHVGELLPIAEVKGEAETSAVLPGGSDAAAHFVPPPQRTVFTF